MSATVHRTRATPATPDAAAMHRRRFLAPACTGRRIAIIGAAEADDPMGRDAAAVLPEGSTEPAEVVVAPDPLAPADAAARIAGFARRLERNGVLIFALAEGRLPDGVAAVLEEFAHRATYVQRPLAGSLVMPGTLAASRIAALAEPADIGFAVRLHLASQARLPDLPSGVFEADGAAEAGGAAVPLPVDRPMTLAPDPDLSELRRRAVGLVERLMDRDDAMVSLAAEAGHLRRRLAETAGGGGGGGFEPPRTRHAWPIAETQEAAPTLGLYDRRPDDAAILEGRRGAAFLRPIEKASEADDFAPAVATLNAAARRIPTADEPDASIIIPVYGQLAYTLNCLSSLFAHVSRATAEIIVVDDVSPDATGDVLPLVAGIRHHRRAANGGFIASCNEAAGIARGRILVLLNNDTRVVDGWLDALVDSFSAFPKAGVVGSKLLYPDGAQQEAGGILWRDGSAWNWGRNDDPNRPQYCHARQADYISGASLAVRREVWRALDGFDRHYAPAYCEDADFCLRAAAAGHEVWYQPRSRIIHYEGRTSGTDTGRGVKAYQVVNAQKLFLRWRHTLATHRPNGEAPFLERERGVRMRALVVDATVPTPKQDAGSVTTTQTLGLFAELGYKPYFVPQDNMLFDPEHTTALQAQGIDCAYAPYDASFEEYIQRYGWMFDVILVYRVGVAEAALPILRRFAPRAAVLFHPMDLHFLRMQREADLAGDASRAAAADAMRVREITLIGAVDCTITHSTHERDLLADAVPDAPVVVWPFMFDLHGTSAGFRTRRDICFLGGYRHTPNVDAVRWFAQEILPLVRAEAPDARFVIAGANPTDEVRALAGEHVEVTGLVDDLRDVFDRARVFACSLRVGAGTKGKVSTAMAYGLPVVSTAVGAEGIEMLEGRDYLLADTPTAFAAATLRLWRDEKLWKRMSAASLKLVAENHSLAMGRQVLEAAIETGLRHRLGLG